MFQDPARPVKLTRQVTLNSWKDEVVQRKSVEKAMRKLELVGLSGAGHSTSRKQTPSSSKSRKQSAKAKGGSSGGGGEDEDDSPPSSQNNKSGKKIQHGVPPLRYRMVSHNGMPPPNAAMLKNFVSRIFTPESPFLSRLSSPLKVTPN